MKAGKTTNIALAVAAAGMFAFAPIASHAASEANVHCFGVNNCKGQNDCKSLFSSCKGQSACKGKGFKSMSLKDCKDMGGKLESELMKK